MTAREYLSQIHLLDVKIDQRVKERQMLLELADRTSKVTELERNVLGIIAYLETEKHDAISRLQELDDTRNVTLLYERYVQYKRLEQIAVEMNYTYQYVRELHKKALKEFEKVHSALLKEIV